MAKKKAMVQPPPARSEDLPLFASLELQLKLIKTLRHMKNDRSYTVLEYHRTYASVHFEGDAGPKTVSYKEK